MPVLPLCRGLFFKTVVFVGLLISSAAGFAGEASGAALDSAVPAKEYANWFNDPFFQVRNAIAACPVPLGPLMRESDIRSEEHYRVERGTSCWLAGKCKQPNAYFYDAAIGEAVRQRFAGATEFTDATLWITVRRRFVWIEGCVAPGTAREALEKFVKDIDDVEMVLINVMPGASGKPPYVLMPQNRLHNLEK